MRRKSINERVIGFTLFMLGAAWLLSGYSHWMPKAPQAQPSLQNAADVFETENLAGQAHKRMSCRVLRVYDGDTFGCDINRNGQVDKPKETIRLLGIDSPEMHYSRKNKTFHSPHPVDEPYAKESSEWLTRQVEHKTVWLEFDQRRTDRYDRSLAYAYASEQAGHTINEDSLSAGKAKTLFIGKNRRYQDVFEQAELKAQGAHRGMWANEAEGGLSP